MPTYQAESWIDVQLATIFAQDNHDWRLLIRDDGSTDKTRDILRLWRDRYPEKITLLDEQNPINFGAMKNWSTLLEASIAPYVMFPSWDDVWYPDKVSRALSGIQSLEGRHGNGWPIWVHADVRVVDRNLKQMHPSSWRLLGMKPNRNKSVGRLCLENYGGGATAITNRALVQLATPIPTTAKTFDCWCALVVAAFGILEAQDYICMDWRRHGANRTAGEAESLSGSIRGVLTNPLRHRRAFYEKLKDGQNFARLLLEHFNEELSPRDHAAIDAFLHLQELGFWQRRRAVLKYRILFTSILRTAGLLLMM